MEPKGSAQHPGRNGGAVLADAWMSNLTAKDNKFTIIPREKPGARRYFRCLMNCKGLMGNRPTTG